MDRLYTWTSLLYLTLLGITPAFAQPICETIKDDVDEFTERHVVQVTASHFSSGPQFDWRSVDDRFCLRLHYTREDDRPAIVFEGDTLMLKLENDSVLVLKSQETTIGVPATDEEGVTSTKGVYCYAITPDQLDLINHFWVQKIRIYFRDGHREFHALNDPTWQMGFWRSSNCFRRSLTLKPTNTMNSSYGQQIRLFEP